ncbi:hypothetical protein AGMMS49992_05210 [Clostridia bacterium]|nr:hypothetical protein AGMMS49992_05210 [Clostridia bacterium]
MVLENTRVSVTFDSNDGRIVSLIDKTRGIEYITRNDCPPFRIIREGEAETAGSHFSCEDMCLTWTLDAAKLAVNVTLLDDGIAFRASFTGGLACARAIEYPILGGLRDWGKDGYIAHSYATGVLLNDPLAYIPDSGALRYTPYPESFSGASMQFMAYYEQGCGGLYVAAHDGGAHQKWLNVFKENQNLAISHMFGYEEITSSDNVDISMPYDFVIRFTDGQGWEEAADLYKSWAMGQPWCDKGLARERADNASWLLEQVGACTFGINAGYDRTKWIRRYHEDICTPIFHILGPDWTHEPQTFYKGVPGGLKDWAPDRFNQANLGAIREVGDRFAPFEFDFLVALDKSDPDILRPQLQRFPNPTLSHDAYHFAMLCPCSPFTKQFHRQRDLDVLHAAGVDAMYYDISANNLIKICLADNHGHKPGGGAELTEGYRDIYADTKAALSEAAGHPVPLGTEMINETLIGELDFYQARAWAQPSSTLETYPFREQMRTGQAQMIPLFDWVYHEYGVVRMDGWGKLVAETGSYFRYIVARTYLWGGLYEINHEYSPMEALNGKENDPAEHFFPFEPKGYEYSPEHAAYVRQFAQARIGAANRYWAYGRMIRAPKIDIPKAAFDWYHYNHNKQDSSYGASGTIEKPAVIASAYSDDQGYAALFLANADDTDHPLSFDITPSTFGLSGSTCKLTWRTDFESQSTAKPMDFSLPAEDGSQRITLTVPALTLGMLEIV